MVVLGAPARVERVQTRTVPNVGGPAPLEARSECRPGPRVRPSYKVAPARAQSGPGSTSLSSLGMIPTRGGGRGSRSTWVVYYRTEILVPPAPQAEF